MEINTNTIDKKEKVNPPIVDEGDKKKEEKPIETITVPKMDFEKLVSNVGDLVKDNKMLKSVADKGRLARWESQNRDFKEKVAKVSTMDGLIVTGWRMVIDEVGKNPNTGLWFEKQIIELHFENDTKKEYNYSEFTRLNQKITGKVIRDNKFTDADGIHEVLTLDIEGKEIDIDVRFVN